MTNNQIIKDEINDIISDILKLYISSGKKATGEFEKGLNAEYEENKATIEGYLYLDGRKAGKMPPVKALENWLNAKGIKPISDKMSITSLAWAIAKKIAREGTNDENHLKIYEKVITPSRINDVINKVSKFHVELFTGQLQVELKKLVNNK